MSDEDALLAAIVQSALIHAISIGTLITPFLGWLFKPPKRLLLLAKALPFNQHSHPIGIPVAMIHLFADNAAGAGFGGAICVGVFGILAIGFYFLPTIVAVMRGHKNQAPIAIVNIFLGWLLVGWVVSLAWAFTAQDDEPRYRRPRRSDEPNPWKNPDNPFSYE